MRYGIVLGLLVVVVPAFGVDTPPVPLCDAAQAPGLELLRSVGDGAPWAAVSTTGVTLESVGTGDWYATGLPDATGTERYLVVLTSPIDPTQRIATYAYGARPAQRIVFRTTMSRTDGPITLKQGDSHGQIALEILSGLPSDIASPLTVEATMLRESDGTVTFSERPAVVSDVTEDARSGTWGATLSYALQAGDTATAGVYRAEFTVCYAANECHTLPADDSLVVRIIPAFAP